MADFLFYAFGFLAVVCAALVVANPFSRNPVTSAMFLVLTIVALAGLFVLLDAFFLAAIQILVYAGAVMVLFLFVIMLLDLKAESRQRLRTATLIVGALGALTLLGVLGQAIHHAGIETVAQTAGVRGDTAALGQILFTRYLLPFEAVSVLLLVAMVGVILLSKKHLK